MGCTAAPVDGCMGGVADAAATAVVLGVGLGMPPLGPPLPLGSSRGWMSTSSCSKGAFCDSSEMDGLARFCEA
eukprot:scaffold247264_cov41-Prasinocladus_malaysianus.AAC.1